MRAVPTPPFLRRLVKGLPPASKMMPVEKRKFGCLMGMLPPLFAKSITDWCLENIPDFHLGSGGREFRSHVTLKFGFTDSSPDTIEAVKEFFQGRPPIQVRLGGFGLFTSGYGKWKNEDGDVLFIEVDSPDLHRLNAELSAAFPCKDTHPEYKPHVTVAYLDPSVAESYRGLKAPFLNCSLILDTLEWSGADGATEQFSLSILPQLGSKALDERKNKLGHRYCIDTDTGKHAPCPPKVEEGEEKETTKKPEGKRPARKPVEVSRHKRVLKAIGKVSPAISDGLKYSGNLKEESRQSYAENVARVLHRMPPAARKMVNTYLAAADFYPTTAHLGLYVFGQYGRDNPSKANEAREAISKVIRGEMELAGAVLISGGALRLALDGAGHQDVSDGRYSMGKKTEQGIYSHEFGHVLDGPSRDISGSEQWKEAFEEEIARKDNDPLTKERSWRQWIGETFTGDTSGRKIAKLTEYAATSKEEALAEFSRLLYGSTVSLEDIERDFPKASKVFKDLLLWPDRSGKPDAIFGDIFDERIPLDDQGSHADSLIIEKASKKKTEKTMDTRSAKPSPPSLKSLPNYGVKGRWVTMGAQEGGDEPGKHGGTRVYLGGDGKIEKGPKGTTGKKPSELSEKKPKAKKERKPRLKPPTIKKPEPVPEYEDDDQVVLPDDVDDLDLGNLASEMGDVYDDDDPLVIGDGPSDSKIDTDEDSVELDSDDLDTSGWGSESEEQASPESAEEEPAPGIDSDGDDLDTSGWEDLPDERAFDENAPPEEHLKAMSASVDKWLKDSDSVDGSDGLSPEQKKKYAKYANEVFAKMPAPMLVAVRKSLRSMLFLPDKKALAVVYARSGGKSETVEGFCDTFSGTVCVDGSDEVGAESSSDMMKYGMHVIHGVYAHEICHTLDEDTKHSRSKEWQSAWNDEIVKGKYAPSGYSQTSPAEGFAEFGRCLVRDADLAKKWFPKCYDYWKKQGWLE